MNPVASSHFNFSMLEPKGVVFVFVSEASPLLGLVSLVAPIIAAGNSVVVLASESMPLSAITFSEVLNSSDVPGGVVNVLTGNAEELHEHAARHMDVDAIAFDRDTPNCGRTFKPLPVITLSKSRNSISIGWIRRVKIHI